MERVLIRMVVTNPFSHLNVLQEGSGKTGKFGLLSTNFKEHVKIVSHANQGRIQESTMGC